MEVPFYFGFGMPGNPSKAFLQKLRHFMKPFDRLRETETPAGLKRLMPEDVALSHFPVDVLQRV